MNWKDLLTPRNVGIAVAAVAALAAIDYFAGTNVLGFVGEMIRGAEQ